MITSVHIRGFKTLLETTIELGTVNIFIGANGSGKSNILEAIGVLSSAASGTVDDESVQRRGVRPGLPTLYKSSFQYERTLPEILLEASSKTISYRVSLNNPIEKPSKAWKFKTESLNSEGKDPLTAGVKTWRNKEVGLVTSRLSEFDPDSPEVRFIRDIQDYAIYAPNTPTLRGLIPDSIRGALGLQGGGLAEEVKLLLHDSNESEPIDEMLELMDWIEYPEVTTSASMLLSPSVARQRNILSFKDRFMKDGRNKLTAYDASEGILYAFFVLVLARSANAIPFFSIDNFDQALNPRLAKKLSRLFCKWILMPHAIERQALLTIHNPIVLDGLPLNDNRIRLFTVDRDNRGVTRVNRVEITPELRELAKEKDWPLSRLWVMGHIGGVPNV